MTRGHSGGDGDDPALARLAAAADSGAEYNDSAPNQWSHHAEADALRIRADAAAAFSALQAGGGDQAGEEAGGNALTQEAFRRGAARLGLDYYREAEVHRVWKRLHRGKKVPRTTEITKAAFCQAALENESVYAIVEQVCARVAAQRFVVPEAYDYGEPTHRNYAWQPLEFFGPYVEQREGGHAPEKRDYAYHNNYAKERQAWQDEIVRLTVMRHNPQPRPWIVFTCGAMGCGKGFTFRKLSEWGYFPIEDIVRVDPDYFKVLMPEWQGYVQRGLDAGTMTHRESTYIQELCQEAALRRQQNIWVDGSLRDADWFKQVFRDIRTRHPAYRIGIIHVHASEPVVRSRVLERASRTHRSVPEHLIQESLAAPKNTLFELGSLCDWIARIDNEVSPALASFNQIDRSGNWNAMSSRWARTDPAPHEFPNKMAPVALQIVEGLRLQDDAAFPVEGGLAKLKYRPRGSADAPATFELRVTPTRMIYIALTVTGDIARRYLGIDEEAMWVALVLPAGPGNEVFEHGGVLYFDRSKRLILATRIAGQCSTCRHQLFVHFNDSVYMSAEEIRALLSDESRWGPVTMQELRTGGARRCTWVAQGELPDVVGMGAFLFELDSGKFVMFTLRVPTR